MGDLKTKKKKLNRNWPAGAKENLKYIMNKYKHADHKVGWMICVSFDMHPQIITVCTSWDTDYLHIKHDILSQGILKEDGKSSYK